MEGQHLGRLGAGLTLVFRHSMRLIGIHFVLYAAVWMGVAAEKSSALLNADHWAFQPPKPMEGGSIDGFISDRLRAEGLSRNAATDRRTLLRRLTFSLHGLPPTPAEINAFLNDQSDGAVARVIDRLLKSPRYGERWARHWLDVVRFSESQGFERDKIRPDAWNYRDYVIKSLNADKPYDQFVREQIAGDVIDPVTREGIKATGFLVAGPYDEVGNGQRSQLMRMRVREDELEDIISAVGQTFLGVTINCSRCHDHKFDPIPQEDYYAVKAVFEGVFHGTPTYLTPAEVKQRQADEARLRKEFKTAGARYRELKLMAIKRLTAFRAPGKSTLKPYLRWSFQGNADDSIQGVEGRLHKGARIERGRLILDGKAAHLESEILHQTIGEKTLEGWVVLKDLNQRAGALVSLYQEQGIVFDAIVYGERRPRAWMAGSDYFKRTVDLGKAIETEAEKLIHMAVTYGADNSIAVYRNGRLLGGYTPKNPLFRFDQGKAKIYIGRRTKVGYLKGEVEEVRLYDRALTADEVRQSFRAGPILFSEEQILAALPPKERLEYESLGRRTTDLSAAMRAAKERPKTYAVRTAKPQPTPYLFRGDVTKKGKIMTPRALVAVTSVKSDLGLTTESTDADRRRHFAEWLTDPANPLLARVMVNRVWHYHFGQGLVDTPSDFGVSGSRPSHPKLLDWLALKFVEDGWSIKDLHRSILSSAVFRQSSAFNNVAAAKDADNRLLWRFAPKRLEAEAVRDSMLALSGQLNLQMGGPGYQPFDLEINNTHFYHTKDKVGPEFNRRTIYRIGVQSLRQPLLDTLDCPDLSTKTPVRGVTTTPIQALALMNDSFVQRQARFMAERLAESRPDDVPGQVRYGFEMTYGRLPSDSETSRAAAHVREHGLQQLCWALLNSSEFIYVR